MARFPRFERQQQRETGVIARNAGADSDSLARTLEDFSSRRSAELDRMAQEQGYAAGLEQPEGPIGGNDRTIAGRAFREGATVAHQAALQTDIRDSVGRFAIEHPNDPAAFDAKVEGLQQGLLKETDPRLHPFVQQRLADYAGRAKLTIIETQRTELQKQATQDLEHGAQGFLDDATTGAFEGDILMVEARRKELGGLLERGVAGQLITPTDAAKFKQRFEHEVTSQEVVGNFDRVLRGQGLEAAGHSIREWQATKPSEVGLTADEHEAVTRQLVALKNREEALQADNAVKRTAAFRAERDLRASRVTDAISALHDGFAPPPDTAKQVAEDISWLRASGDEADRVNGQQLAADFDVAQAIQGQVHRFRRMPERARADELAALEGELRRGGATADQVALVKALRETNADVNRQLENDPRGYVQREGLVEDKALDTSSAGALADSIDARGAATDVGRGLIGRPLPRLTAAEAHQLAGVYNDPQTSIEEKVALLGVVTAGAGDDAKATLSQLDKDGYKRMALVGSYVMTGQGALARDIMRGEAVLANDSGIKPKRTDYQGELDDHWGAALSDWPEQRGEYLEAAFAKYAELKNRQGDLSDVYNPRLMRQALDEILPTASFNGRRVAVPVGVTERAFDDWVEQWTPADFVDIAGANADEALELARDRGRLIELGDGRYGVSVSSAASQRDKYLVRADGKPFTLTYPRGQ